MKNKKLFFSVIFTGILFLNTFLFTNINESKLLLNSLFTLATAQTENVENGEASGSGDKRHLGNHTISWSGTAYHVKIKVGLDAGKTRWVFKVDPDLHIQLGYEEKSLSITKYCDKCDNPTGSDCLMSEFCKITEAELNMFF